MRIAYILLASLCLPVTLAENDSAIAGPYKVSFDIGLPRSDYNITVTESQATEGLSGDKRTEYYVAIVNNTGLIRAAGITIKSLETPIPIVSGSDWSQALNSKLNDPRVSQLRTASRAIDGTVGGIASYTLKPDSGAVIDAYQVDYQPDFDPTHTVVEIFSTYPWEEGTLQLLKTIHIENINKTIS